VHFADHGFPVVGDPVYRPRKLFSNLKDKLPHHSWPAIDPLKSASRQMLHAWQLSLTHPHSGQYMTFESPLPADMEVLLVILRENG
jgi:23S rRNA pseudouridine1911/1915/1917 synthase